MGPILFFTAMLVALGYVVLIMRTSDGWDDTTDWQSPPQYKTDTLFTVLIPARDEEKNLEKLLTSILSNNQKVAPYEVIVIDDHSSDNSHEVLSRAFPAVKYLRLPTGTTGKKAAIEYGLAKAKGKIVICTDADCTVSDQWISSIASYFEIQRVDFITGLVRATYHYRILDAYQFLDFAGMMPVTAAGIQKKKYYIANGANMAFKKESFEDVGGFSGNNKIASGDDMFLIQAMEKADKKIRFLKSANAVVTTQSEKSFSDILKQRKRWAAKTKHYSGRNITKVQTFVFLVHVVIIIYFIIAPLTGGLSFFAGLFLFFIKTLMDYLLVAKTCRYYNYTEPLKYFLPSVFIQMIVLFYSGLMALKGGSYSWKGRRIT